MELRYKRVHEHAPPPRRAYAGDAGLDLACCGRRSVCAGGTARLGTGLAFEIPDGHVGIITSRSSLQRGGIIISGVIDSGYRGEVYLIVTNTSSDDWTFAGYIAQMILVPFVSPALVPVDSLSDSERGLRGFGSSD